MGDEGLESDRYSTRATLALTYCTSVGSTSKSAKGVPMELKFGKDHIASSR